LFILGGSSPVQAVAAGLTAPNGPAGKAINGIKVAYHQSGLKGKISSSLVTTQQPDVAGGGSKDMARMIKVIGYTSGFIPNLHFGSLSLINSV